MSEGEVDEAPLEVPEGYRTDDKGDLQPIVQGLVAAVGAASADLSLGLDPAGRARTSQIRDAMVRAIEEAQAEGITDPGIIKERMQTARQMAKLQAPR
jgi:2-keto-3-deoxy-L-rhamnonate aldolase RhmA